MNIIRTYVVKKEPNKDGVYSLYAVHTSNFSKETLQDILDGKSFIYENLGMFSDEKSAIETAIKKGYSKINLIR